MNKLKKLIDGEKVDVFFSNNKQGIFTIFGTCDDELLLINLNDELSSFPGKELIIAQTVTIKGVKINIGDKVTVMTKNGKMIEMFVNCLFGKSGLSLSLSKDSNNSSLNWLLKLISRL